MLTPEEFERDLWDALNNLYDPMYTPGQAARHVMGADSASPEMLRVAILRNIDALSPPPGVPEDTRAHRLHIILHLRYVKGMTQEQTAELLAISTRHLRREQHDAISLLANHLWQQYVAVETDAQAAVNETPASTNSERRDGPSWREQIKEEMGSLLRVAPSQRANVAEAARAAVRVLTPLARARGARLRLGNLETGLWAAVHLSALRQIMVTCVSELLRERSPAEITLSAHRADHNIEIVVAASPPMEVRFEDNHLLAEVLNTGGGTLLLSIDEHSTTVRISLPTVDPITVLVVEDNVDLLHFYQRYTDGTRFRLEHISEGARLFETIEAICPDMIVLDVMLPDVDGWDLLVQLHAHPLTSALPIVVCSVVREPELALALGASAYVPKPVRRAEFIDALEQAAERLSGARTPVEDTSTPH